MSSPATPRRDPTAHSGRVGAPSSDTVAERADGVPRHAWPPLAVCVAAALIGGLALFAATRREMGESGLLLVIGWSGVAISAVASIVFAARSGRLEEFEPARQSTTIADDRSVAAPDLAAD